MEQGQSCPSLLFDWMLSFSTQFIYASTQSFQKNAANNSAKIFNDTFP